MLEFARVSLGEGGAARCTRCHPQAPPDRHRPASEIAEEVAGVAAAWTGGPGPNVELGGAEPFGHPELPGVVAECVRAGVERLRLHTDASDLPLGGNAPGVIAAGVCALRVTLLGGSPGMHDALAGCPGALDATVTGVKAFVAAAAAQGAAVDVLADVPVCRHNARDLPTAVSLAAESGARTVRLRLEDGGMDLKGSLGWILAACDTGVVNRSWVEVQGLPLCLAGEHGLHVADVVRERPGTHGPGCAACALRHWCAGGPVDASAEMLSLLAPPPDAEERAARVRRAREVIAP